MSKPTKPTQLAPISDMTCDAILAKRVNHTPVSLTFDPKTTFEEWLRAHEFYQSMETRSQWYIGDSLIHGESYGERYAQVVDPEQKGKSYSYLTTIVSVCRQIPPERRRQTLSFSMHEAVAYIAPQEADKLLDRAEKENWSRQDLRDAVAKLNGRPPKAQRERHAKTLEEGKVKVLPPADKPSILICDNINAIPQADQDAAELIIVADAKTFRVEKSKLTDDIGHTGPRAKMKPWIEEYKARGTKTPPTIEAETTPVKPQPEAQAPRQHALKPTAAPSTPPEAKDPVKEAELALANFIATIPSIPVDSMKPLTVKKWLGMLIPIDKLIDSLQKKIGLP